MVSFFVYSYLHKPSEHLPFENLHKKCHSFFLSPVWLRPFFPACWTPIICQGLRDSGGRRRKGGAGRGRWERKKYHPKWVDLEIRRLVSLFRSQEWVRIPNDRCLLVVAVEIPTCTKRMIGYFISLHQNFILVKKNVKKTIKSATS